MVKLLDLQAITMMHGDEYKAAANRVIESGWFLQGNENKQFEKDYAQYIGTDECVAVANGLDALRLIIRGYKEMGIFQDGDEIIVPANTYIATILAITENNLTPILVEPTFEHLEIDIDKISAMQKEMLGITENEKSYSDAKEVYSYSTDEYVMTHKNVFTDEYIDYIENINPEYVQSIGYTRITGVNLLMEQHGEVVPVNTKDINFVSYPKALTEEGEGYLETNYDLLIGEYPQNANEVVLVIDDKNQVQDTILRALGYDQKTISFDDLLGLRLKAILNNDYYSATDMGIYTMNTNYEEMYSSNNAIDLKVVGIIRGKKK